MPTKESYSGARYEPTGSECGEQLSDAAKLILLNEYESLLRTIEPIRMLNRSLLIAIVLLQLVHGPFAVLNQVPLLIATALASCFWFLQEFSTRRRLGRLGELIASANGELATGMKGEYARPVILPPLRKESQTTRPSSLAQVAPSTEAGESLSSVTSGQIWTNTYVNWHHEARKDRRLQALQRAEPIIWFGLAIGFKLYHVILMLR
jgi:hypothetical protein